MTDGKSKTKHTHTIKELGTHIIGREDGAWQQPMANEELQTLSQDSSTLRQKTLETAVRHHSGSNGEWVESRPSAAVSAATGLG